MSLEAADQIKKARHQLDAEVPADIALDALATAKLFVDLIDSLLSQREK